MQGLQRATEAARASRGLKPRTVHERTTGGALCGCRAEVFADTPNEVTCRNCLRVIERNRSKRRITADANWAALRKAIAAERARRSVAAGVAATAERQNRYWGWTDALDWVLALMDAPSTATATTEEER